MGLQNLRKPRVSIASAEGRKREKERLNRNGFGFFSGIFWWAFIFGFEREKEKEKRVRFLRNLKGQKKKKSTFALRFMVVYCRPENGVSRSSRKPDDENISSFIFLREQISLASLKLFIIAI